MATGGAPGPPDHPLLRALRAMSRFAYENIRIFTAFAKKENKISIFPLVTKGFIHGFFRSEENPDFIEN